MAPVMVAGRGAREVLHWGIAMKPLRSTMFGPVLLLAWLSGCGREEAARPTDWIAAAAAVRPSVHSVWASREALEGMTAFAPVGTGFVIAVDSVGSKLLTNAHAITTRDGTPLRRISVLVHSDTGSVVHGAAVLAVDGERDLALLGIPTVLTPVRWAAARVPMGTPVATIGYGLPEGGIVDTTGAQVITRFTVPRRFTAGYSSSYRTLTPGDPSTNVLELDLFLFPGVSGGPAFTRDGLVLGVNQGGWALPGGTTSYGHAIPALVVRQFLEAEGYLRWAPPDPGGAPQ